MSIIALTGGLGSGKSEAAKQFAKLGVPVVDTDVIAHALTANGAPALKQISELFGPQFLTNEGALDRAKLRAHVFAHPQERSKLEALLHPLIRAAALKQLAENEHQQHPDYQILVIPLLFENNQYQTSIHKILLIDCDEQLQIARAMARSFLTQAEAQAILDAQVSRTTRLKLADEVIENNGTLAELTESVEKMHQKLIKICH
ncbi:MAG: dephospho-CoA kinase [Methylotenera sp.]|jgi:dephospho-CoA kinase|nr:dephospho-CoA kinase [Methylotenera sp.]HOY86890.1 dephospho-CoA kinase [Methylotenera sp.]HPH07622.1 dephospho-CoA kinase [Methylotenera sp.]HPM49623.1 dephospho-CoA kinase [Methylotenera sp.]HPV32709.1 dephospho-CoA kinase [Methylotenera sp.]